MAGSATAVVTNTANGGKLIVWTVVSHATNGTVSGVGGVVVSGRVACVRFVSDAGGTQPSDLWDATIIDANSHDILFGVGANINRVNSTSTNRRTPLTGDGGFVYLENETITPALSNMGNSKGAVISLWVE